jgi:hypothetical protein
MAVAHLFGITGTAVVKYSKCSSARPYTELLVHHYLIFSHINGSSDESDIIPSRQLALQLGESTVDGGAAGGARVNLSLGEARVIVPVPPGRSGSRLSLTVTEPSLGAVVGCFSSDGSDRVAREHGFGVSRGAARESPICNRGKR